MPMLKKNLLRHPNCFLITKNGRRKLIFNIILIPRCFRTISTPSIVYDKLITVVNIIHCELSNHLLNYLDFFRTLYIFRKEKNSVWHVYWRNFFKTHQFKPFNDFDGKKIIILSKQTYGKQQNKWCSQVDYVHFWVCGFGSVYTLILTWKIEWPVNIQYMVTLE